MPRSAPRATAPVQQAPCYCSRAQCRHTTAAPPPPYRHQTTTTLCRHIALHCRPLHCAKAQRRRRTAFTPLCCTAILLLPILCHHIVTPLPLLCLCTAMPRIAPDPKCRATPLLQCRASPLPNCPDTAATLPPPPRHCRHQQASLQCLKCLRARLLFRSYCEHSARRQHRRNYTRRTGIRKHTG